MPSEFTTSFFASFDDGDPGGIVFFGNYYRIAHRALEQFIIDTGIPWSEWFANPELIAPLVHSEADYMKPLFCGKHYLAKVSVEKVGSTSVTFSYTFFNEQKEVCSRLKTVHVFLNPRNKSKVSVPEHFATALSPY